MSRLCKFPPKIVRMARELDTSGHGYGTIRKMIARETRISVGESTVRDWCKYWIRAAA